MMSVVVVFFCLSLGHQRFTYKRLYKTLKQTLTFSYFIWFCLNKRIKLKLIDFTYQSKNKKNRWLKCNDVHPRPVLIKALQF